MRAGVWSLLLLYICKHTEMVPALPHNPTSPAHSFSALVTPTEDESIELVDWLTRYGYLPPPDPSTGQLQAWTAVTQAVRAMQKFAGLKETGVVDGDTLNLMRTPRCSLPDEGGDGIVPPLHTENHHHRQKRRSPSTWSRRSINWRLRSYPTSTALSREMIRSLVFYALKVWAEPTKLEFHEVASPEGADLQVDFLHGSHGDGFPFDGVGGAVGHAFFPSDPDRAGGVHLDSEEDWSFRQPASEGTDLFTVLVHEFGHALGLSHSSSRHSVMRPYYQGPVGDPLRFTLGSQDREQITKLYGKQDNLLTTDFPDLSLQPHLRHRGHRIAEKHSNEADRCTTSFDAVARIRGDMFFFKDLNMWRVSSGGLVSEKAASIRRMWGGLPPNLSPLQAVFERRSDHTIVFITGSQFWFFNDLALQEGYPQPLHVLGVRGGEQGLVWDTEKGVVWGDKNKRNSERLESETWRELLSEGVNGITTDSDGSIYIFKDHLYWKFSHPGSAPDAGYPRALATDWLDCPRPSSALPEGLSFGPPTGRQEFHGMETKQERDQEMEDKKRFRKDRGKMAKEHFERERDSLEHWLCSK
ncbi:matrix metalloproteinase-17b [Scleropages formosus]|uniref:matrix metalloproteinase-17b n=1 Tax=Scleropages formosus TaxID=113540 RepID=UPI0010FACDFE|nr:matrix metalloproteinase-17-like [Scleropages formosus]